MPNRLTPTTRQRLNFIGWFFILDALICLVASYMLPVTSGITIDSVIATVIFGLLGGCLLGMLYATRNDGSPVDLRKARTRE
jgi:membrane associated rhomboid family serine protease